MEGALAIPKREDREGQFNTSTQRMEMGFL
jgi:hypothetical protein